MSLIGLYIYIYIYIYIYVAVCSVNWIASNISDWTFFNVFFSQILNTGCNTAVSTNQPGQHHLQYSQDLQHHSLYPQWLSQDQPQHLLLHAEVRYIVYGLTANMARTDENRSASPILSNCTMLIIPRLNLIKLSVSIFLSFKLLFKNRRNVYDFKENGSFIN